MVVKITNIEIYMYTNWVSSESKFQRAVDMSPGFSDCLANTLPSYFSFIFHLPSLWSNSDICICCGSSPSLHWTPPLASCDCISLPIMILLWWLTWLILSFLWYTGLWLQILLFSKDEDYGYLLLHQFKFLFHREVLVAYRKLLAFCFKVLWLTKNTLLKSIGTGFPLGDPTPVSLPLLIKLVQHVWLRDLALSFSTGKNSLF